MADDEQVFVYFTDENGIRRQVRVEDVDSVPDTWTSETPVAKARKPTTK
jgi:hypothetical protein